MSWVLVDPAAVPTATDTDGSAAEQQARSLREKFGDVLRRGEKKDLPDTTRMLMQAAPTASRFWCIDAALVLHMVRHLTSPWARWARSMLLPCAKGVLLLPTCRRAHAGP